MSNQISDGVDPRGAVVEQIACGPQTAAGPGRDGHHDEATDDEEQIDAGATAPGEARQEQLAAPELLLHPRQVKEDDQENGSPRSAWMF